jgi:hypothetical protein
MSFTFPSFSQWKQIFKVLKKKEKITFLCFFVLALGSLGFLTTDFYINHTNVAPALGGTYIEGVVEVTVSDHSPFGRLVGRSRGFGPMHGDGSAFVGIGQRDVLNDEGAVTAVGSQRLTCRAGRSWEQIKLSSSQSEARFGDLAQKERTLKTCLIF